MVLQTVESSSIPNKSEAKQDYSVILNGWSMPNPSGFASGWSFLFLRNQKMNFPFLKIKKSLLQKQQGFVGVAGFEPAASCSQSRRDNRATLHPEAAAKIKLFFAYPNLLLQIKLFIKSRHL
jgi:hypothetical protein